VLYDPSCRVRFDIKAGVVQAPRCVFDIWWVFNIVRNCGPRDRYQKVWGSNGQSGMSCRTGEDLSWVSKLLGVLEPGSCVCLCLCCASWWQSCRIDLYLLVRLACIPAGGPRSFCIMSTSCARYFIRRDARCRNTDGGHVKRVLRYFGDER
jgi:hypothetical protein